MSSSEYKCGDLLFMGKKQLGRGHALGARDAGSWPRLFVYGILADTGNVTRLPSASVYTQINSAEMTPVIFLCYIDQKNSPIEFWSTTATTILAKIIVPNGRVGAIESSWLWTQD